MVVAYDDKDYELLLPVCITTTASKPAVPRLLGLRRDVWGGGQLQPTRRMPRYTCSTSSNSLYYGLNFSQALNTSKFTCWKHQFDRVNKSHKLFIELMYRATRGNRRASQTLVCPSSFAWKAWLNNTPFRLSPGHMTISPGPRSAGVIMESGEIISKLDLAPTGFVRKLVIS